MHRNFEEDSGRSSCSAASIGLSPIIDYHCTGTVESSNQSKKHQSETQEVGVNTDLQVSNRPRSCISLVKSPDDKDPFPSVRVPRNRRKPVFNIFNTPRLGGLSNAHSTIDIASSTPLEQPILQNNAVSLSTVNLDKHMQVPLTNEFRRVKPVQRVASRLYRAECGIRNKDGCTGPEFIVRASQPAKHIDLTASPIADKRIITVVLLNGQKVEVLCDPNTVTAGQVFKALVHTEKYEHNFMLGIAVLVAGDFIFMPEEYKIKKIAPQNWSKLINKKKCVEEKSSLIVFLRIKFFLPTNIARNIEGGEWRHRVYLQLRRATVEGQLTSSIQNLILLAGYALHVEFGEFSYREHGTADYFLLEHYLPENSISNDMADIKLRMKRAHESRRGLENNKAIINYITLAQTFRDYGAHFYSATWATRDGFCRDIWLSIGPRGVTLYSRSNHTSEDGEANANRIVLQSLPWHHIDTFYYNKKSLYIMPNSYSGLSKIGIKYKLRMSDNKSYFTYWLASLHHKLYLKLYAKEDFINFLSSDISCSNDSPIKTEQCSNYEDSYNLAVRNPARVRRPVRRRFKVDIFKDRKTQNKENEKPSTEEMLRQILLPQQSDDSNLNASNSQGNSSNDGVSSSESCSLPRRHGVKMGTRVFNGMKSPMDKKFVKAPVNNDSNNCTRSDNDLATAQSDSDDLSSEQRQCNINSMKLLPERHYNHVPTAYVLESPKVYSDVFNYNTTSNDSCLNTSLFEKLDKMGGIQGERVFVTASIERDENNALGLQVAEGSDGNVYIKSITPGGPADTCKKIMPGDQIISVNGKTLLNVKYDKALTMLQSAMQNVEIIVLQNANKNYSSEYDPNSEDTQTKGTILNQKGLRQSIASALDGDITDDELLNEEALKTIYALIKLTKEKVISRMKYKSSRQLTPNKSSLQKCSSQNKVCEETSNYFSQDLSRTTCNQKFNTWRGQTLQTRTKRRPLSLSIPADVHLSDDYFDDSTDYVLTKRSSMNSVQTSLNNLDIKSVNSGSCKNVALPRNFGLSRRWLGPVRYPVTPCKNNADQKGNAVINDNIVRRHFVYGAGDSDEDQIFL